MPRRARAWAISVLASPAQGHSSQIWVCHRGYPSVTQNLKPIFSYISQHAGSTQINSRSKRKLFCGRAARAPGQNQFWPAQPRAIRAKIWVCHRGYPSLTQNLKSIISYAFQHANSTQINSRCKRKLFCAPRRARAWAKLVLVSPTQGHSSKIWVCHRGYPSLTQNFKLICSYILQHADSTQIDSRSKRQLFCLPRRARLGTISSGQLSPGSFDPNLDMSPGMPQFDPEFQTHLFQLFSACRFLPNQFRVKTAPFLRAAPRARLGKISVGQPSPGPFQPNLGMSLAVPQFDQELPTHLFLHFAAWRFQPKSIPGQNGNFFARHAARAWAKSVLASSAQGHSSQIWICHQGCLSLTPSFKPIFFKFFLHADSSQIDSRSKQKLFCAPRGTRAWAKSVLASPGQGHSRQSWVYHRGYPSLTQSMKPIFSGFLLHANSSQIDSQSKQKLFCVPRRARAWAISVLASPSQGEIWVCHQGYPSLKNNFKLIFFYNLQHANSTQINSR